jgi:hypothetical protein
MLGIVGLMIKLYLLLFFGKVRSANHTYVCIKVRIDNIEDIMLKRGSFACAMVANTD